MADFAELAKVGTVAIIVPLAVFSANWIHRSNKGYSQTAAADFILAVLIFDCTVVIIAHEFEPFIRAPELRPFVVYWHVAIAFISGLIWAGIVTWGEPALAKYYEAKRHRPSFPAATFLICWMSVLMLITAHVAFFVVTKDMTHG